MSEITHGILLTGGRGVRMANFTERFSKHLYPINDRFIIEYPLNTLKKAGVKNLTVVLGSEHYSQIVDFLQDGSRWGFNINYILQKSPHGIAQAINICQPYVGDGKFLVVLGDNFFEKPLRIEDKNKARIFINRNENLDLKQFGVISLWGGEALHLEEKPNHLDDQADNYAITGAYIFNQQYFEYYKNIKMSDRCEYEIVDIIKQYLDNGELEYNIQPGYWSDLGTYTSINSVSAILKTNPIKF